MQKHNFNNLQDFINGWKGNQKYFDMLALMAQLSRLFSDSEVPYLDYRLTENLFCRYYKALNDARSCTAYDARISKIGIGIKTFILSGKDQSTEKIAEFNKLKKELEGLKGLDLARQIATFRNDRMRFANDTFDVTETQYHIVGRKEGLLRIFNCPYEEVNIDKIHLDKDDATSIRFHDEKNEYSFNKSKSVLMKHFEVPKNGFMDVKVEILDEPLDLLEDFFTQRKSSIGVAKKRVRGIDYVILPLYSTQKKNVVPEKSGLNQWNAGGRKRDEDEVYIPVPKYIHRNFPNFFPQRDEPFALHLPDGKILSAKICQDGGKALMSNPNKDLGNWILRKVMHKKPWSLVTKEDLDRFGFDSICVENLHKTNERGECEYSISFTLFNESYDKFIEETE